MPARRQLFALACLALALLLAMPTAGRLLLAGSGGHYGPGTAGVMAHHGHHAPAALPAAPDGAEEEPPAAADDEFCPYCPLVASLVVFVLLWLLAPPWPCTAAAPGGRRSPRLLFRLPYGLGPCGPPLLRCVA